MPMCSSDALGMLPFRIQTMLPRSSRRIRPQHQHQIVPCIARQAIEPQVVQSDGTRRKLMSCSSYESCAGTPPSSLCDAAGAMKSEIRLIATCITVPLLQWINNGFWPTADNGANYTRVVALKTSYIALLEVPCENFLRLSHWKAPYSLPCRTVSGLCYGFAQIPYGLPGSLCQCKGRRSSWSLASPEIRSSSC